MAVVGYVIGGSVGIALGALLGAFIVQYATLAVANFKPLYWQAYKAALIGAAVGYLLVILSSSLIGNIELANAGALSADLLTYSPMVFGVLLQGYLYGLLIVQPGLRSTLVDGSVSIGFVKGLLVALIQLAIGSLLIYAVMMLA